MARKLIWEFQCNLNRLASQERAEADNAIASKKLKSDMLIGLAEEEECSKLRKRHRAAGLTYKSMHD